MPYNRTVWENNKTPLNADNMNNIEDGIVEAKESSENAKVSASNALTRANQAYQQVQNVSNQASQSIAQAKKEANDYTDGEITEVLSKGFVNNDDVNKKLEGYTSKNTTEELQKTITGIKDSYIKSIKYDSKHGIFTIINQNEEETPIDLAIEKVVANFTYDKTAEELVLTLADGSEQRIAMSALVVDGYTKVEANATFASKNYAYSKEESDAKYALKGESGNPEELEELKTTQEEHTTKLNSLEAGLNNRYTKTQANETFAPKATEANVNNLITKVTDIEASYVKNVMYDKNTGVLTFIFKDGKTVPIDFDIEKVVTNFEYVTNYVKKESTPTDLTGYTVTVPPGWSVTSRYGLFILSFECNGYVVEDGYLYFGYNIIPGDGPTGASNYIICANSILTPNDSFSITFYNGQDVTNQSLIQWFVDNGATFTKESSSSPGESGLLLTLADGTPKFISLANFIKDYTGKDGDQIQINIVNHEVSAVLKDGSIKINHLDSKFASDVNTIFTAVGELTTKANTNATDISDLKTKTDTTNTRVSTVETKANTLETNLSGLQDRVTSLEQNQGSGGSGSGAVSSSIFESVTINDFSALEEAQGPYTHFANVTLTNSLDDKASVELLNNNAVLFATYGFAIASVSSGNVVTVYSINKSAEAVTLTFEIVKAYKVFDGTVEVE